MLSNTFKRSNNRICSYSLRTYLWVTILYKYHGWNRIYKNQGSTGDNPNIVGMFLTLSPLILPGGRRKVTSAPTLTQGRTQDAPPPPLPPKNHFWGAKGQSITCVRSCPLPLKTVWHRSFTPLWYFNTRGGILSIQFGILSSSSLFYKIESFDK